MRNSEPDGATSERYPIASVDNALRLLLLFRDQPMVRIADAADHLGVARSTAHRLIRMLAHHGFVRQDPASKAYLPGTALMDVGLSVVSRMDLRGAAHDRMEALAHRTGETVHLARLELPNVLFVDCVESSKAIRVASRVGHVLPAHCTSVGKAMLAAGGEDLQDYFAGQPLPTVTSQSISSHSKLEQELAAVREQGFATSSGESEDGVGSVGVAVVDRLDRVVGGISIAVPLFRLSESDLCEFAAEAKQTAEDVGRALG